MNAVRASLSFKCCRFYVFFFFFRCSFSFSLFFAFCFYSCLFFYLQMAVNNPYGVMAVTDEEAELMRAYTPACVKLIEGCQHVPEVGAASDAR